MLLKERIEEFIKFLSLMDKSEERENWQRSLYAVIYDILNKIRIYPVSPFFQCMHNFLMYLKQN